MFDENELAGAVLFFSDEGEIFREMTYSEFEAVLDGYVPAVELAGVQCQAVYVEFNSDFLVRNAVFFQIQFTSKGEIEKSWALPLPQISFKATSGPDMGAGAIGLTCRSHCHVEQYRHYLWDPSFKGAGSEFSKIKQAVARNRVAIQFKVSEEKKQQIAETAATSKLEAKIEARLRKEYSKEFRDHMAQVIKEQRMRAKMLINEREKAIKDIKVQYTGRIDDYRMMVDEKNRLIEEERERNSQLKETIKGQAEKIAGLREYFELKLEKAQGAGSTEIRQMREELEIETQAKVEAATMELKEMLQMREVELLYRNEQEINLHDEITRLRRENNDLVSKSGDYLLSSLVEKGISFVTYQPGAGHITLPIGDIAEYMENPTAYVAKFCGVKEDHYQAWLEHYHVPICRAQNSDGSMCGENINRIESPVDFIVGETDCCFKHRTSKTPKLKIAGGN